MLLFILALLCSATWVNSQVSNCPDEYLKLTSQHSYCLPPNPTCNIQDSGVSQDDIDQILKLHNQYRSHVAMGQETRGGGLPSASDMMQMVWDDELAAIAQKWANHCVYEHDCGDCRSVANFPVGQNIAYQDTICDSKQCFKNIEASDLQPDWPSVLKNFYDEIDDFDNKLVPNFQMLGGKEINHFTQMIWGKSWRLGCGLTVFTKGRLSYRRFYVCNYGKAGNVIGQPMYEQGRPGSGCPVNSCVGGANCNGNDYPGLCQMLNSNTAPVYPRSQSSKDLFYCDSSPDTDDCAVSANGTNNWGFASSLEGNYLTITLNGGESSTLFFQNKISPTKSNFCVRIVIRKGPTYPANQDWSVLQANFKPDGYNLVTLILDLTSRDMFAPYSLDLSWKADTDFSLTFSVKNGAKSHTLDIEDIEAFDGKCSSRKT